MAGNSLAIFDRPRIAALLGRRNRLHLSASHEANADGPDERQRTARRAHSRGGGAGARLSRLHLVAMVPAERAPVGDSLRDSSRNSRTSLTVQWCAVYAFTACLALAAPRHPRSDRIVGATAPGARPFAGDSDALAGDPSELQ